MTNLLAETIQAVVASGHSIQDVKCVRSRDGRYATTWKEFAEIANFNYDAGFGAAHVAQDLVVEFQDDTFLYRQEYDGSEWWAHSRPLIPVSINPAKITKVEARYWSELEDIHEYQEEDYV